MTRVLYLALLFLFIGCADKIPPKKQIIIKKNQALSQTKKINFIYKNEKVLITTTRVLSKSEKNYEFFVITLYPKSLQKGFSTYILNEKVSLNKLASNSEILSNLPFINEWSESFYAKIKKQDEDELKLDFKIYKALVASLTFQLD